MTTSTMACMTIAIICATLLAVSANNLPVSLDTGDFDDHWAPSRQERWKNRIKAFFFSGIVIFLILKFLFFCWGADRSWISHPEKEINKVETNPNCCTKK